MIIREEIREGIAKTIYKDWGHGWDWDKKLQGERDQWLETADKLLVYLHSKGVVINKGLPKWSWHRTQIYKTLQILGAIPTKTNGKETMYTAVEPLIKK